MKQVRRYVHALGQNKFVSNKMVDSQLWFALNPEHIPPGLCSLHESWTFGKVNDRDGIDRIDTVAIIDLAFLGNLIQIKINLICVTLPKEAKAIMAMAVITDMLGALL